MCFHIADHADGALCCCTLFRNVKNHIPIKARKPIDWESRSQLNSLRYTIRRRPGHDLERVSEDITQEMHWSYLTL
jgi:hypothetical protein